MTNARFPLPNRPEVEFDVTAPKELGDVAKPLSLFEKLAANGAVRRGLILIAVALIFYTLVVYAIFRIIHVTLTLAGVAVMTRCSGGCARCRPHRAARASAPSCGVTCW